MISTSRKTHAVKREISTQHNNTKTTATREQQVWWGDMWDVFQNTWKDI